MSYQPPFQLSNAIVGYVADIAQKVGHAEILKGVDASPQLRRGNRIRTIHSSLAIENNTLSLEQVTAVIEGKHVIAPPKDILEVQNALAAYEELDSLDPCSVEDLLRAHGILMKGLTSEAGRFRSGDVGVFDGDRLVHAGTPAAYVPEVIAELFAWLAERVVHPLVASCVFHYEFEFVHPFQDGNGRMGRLWQTLILSKWNRLFAWLPVESLVKDHQKEYYEVLAQADARADCTCFIEFMLQMISSALDDAMSAQRDGGIDDGINDGMVNESARTELRLLALVRANPMMTIAQMAEVLGISKRQAERIVAKLKGQGKLVREGARRNGRWAVNEEAHS